MTFFLSACLGPVTRSLPEDQQGRGELVEGIRSFEAGRYPQARERFLRIIASYPGSPLLEEAQWLLAKSYEAAGEKEPAIREFHLYLRNYPNSAHEEEAHAFLFRLEQSDRRTIAVTWSPASGRTLEESLRRFKKWGANAVVVPVAENGAEGSGLYFRSVGAPLVGDRLPEWAETAHRLGYRLIAKMPLREMRWAALARPEWQDGKFDPERGVVRPIEKLDLFRPEVKEWLRSLYRDLASYPIDGIYVDDLAYPIDEGWSASAVRQYERLFSESPGPNEWIEAKGGRVPDGARRGGRPPEFWHWVGWRSRHATDLLKELQETVHSVHPGTEWGIGLPETLLADPMKALEETSLDLLDVRRSQTAFYLFLPNPLPLPAQTFLDALAKSRIPPQEVWVRRNTAAASLSSEMRLSPFRGILLASP